MEKQKRLSPDLGREALAVPPNLLCLPIGALGVLGNRASFGRVNGRTRLTLCWAALNSHPAFPASARGGCGRAADCHHLHPPADSDRRGGSLKLRCASRVPLVALWVGLYAHLRLFIVSCPRIPSVRAF